MRWCTATLGTLILAAVVPAADWPRFRGPNAAGIGEVAGFSPRWTAADAAWKVKLPGVGHSSPVIWGERIFVTSGDEQTGKRMLVCLKTTNGEQLWTREFPGERYAKHGDSSFASATPAADSHRVYVTFGGPKDYLVIALDHDGKELWHTDLGPWKAGHGFGPSPILHDDLIILPHEQDGPSAIVALDAATGKPRWKTLRKSKGTYTTPCIFQAKNGAAELICTSYEHGVSSLDPKTGKTYWELDVFDKRHIETSIGSPILAGDLVLATSGWLGVRMEVVAVDPNGGKPKEVYRITRSAPLCTTPLVAGDLLFVWSDGGIVTCADARSGEVHWRERVNGSYYSSPICVGKHIVNVSRDGEMVVLVASKTFEVVGRTRLEDGTNATPAIAGGRLFVRTYSHLFCFGGK